MTREASKSCKTIHIDDKIVINAKKKAIVIALFGLAVANVSAADWNLTYDFTGKGHNNYADFYLPSGSAIQAGDSVTLTSTNQNVLLSGNSGGLHAAKINTAGTKHKLVINGGSFNSENNYNWALYGATRLTTDGLNLESDSAGITMNNVTGHFDIYGAGRVSAASNYHVGTSVVEIADSVINGKNAHGQIYGGGYLDKAGAHLTVDNTHVIIKNVTGVQEGYGNLPGVYGGGNLRDGGIGSLVETKNTLVEIYQDGGTTTLDGVYGGGRISGNNQTNQAKISAVNTKVVIHGGTINEVVGGHHINYFGNGEVTGKSEVEIYGGNIKNVIGGNILDYHAAGGAAETPRSATTKTANVNIKGGTINNVYGGGYAIKPEGAGVTLVSNVTESANVTIDKATINGNIYGGGFAMGTGSSVEVKNAQISISNSTVNGDTITTEGCVATDLSGATGQSKPTTSANMALTNVTATNATVESNVGTVELRAEGDKTTSIGKLKVAPTVQVVLTADGDANDASQGNIKQAIQIQDGDYAGGSIRMAEGMQQGAIQGYIGADGQAHTTQQTNSIMSNTLDLYAGSTLALNRMVMNNVRKRMGDLRSVDDSHGVWARYNGGKFSGKQELKNEFATFEFGVDTVPSAGAPRIGLALSYTQSDADMNRGSADMNVFSLAFYGTKMYDSGLYVDMIGRMGSAKTDVTVDGNKTGSVDNIALSVSGEVGWRFDVTESFYVEPQTELTYTYINDETLTLSEGTSYRFDAVNSVIGRAGVAAGFKCPNNFGDVYARVSAAHEFAGDAAVRSATTLHEVDGKDTWFEYALGANFNLNKNTYIYTELERSSGASFEQDWRINLGVRYSF